MTSPDWIEQIEGALAGSGLFVRGAFHPGLDDNVPLLEEGRKAGTVVLIGNAGNALWQAFQAGEPDMASRHPLDNWVAEHLRTAARVLQATLVDPMRPPYPPIQQWAVRAGAGFRSPINLLIHPDYGLWHTFRGALLTAATLPLPNAPPTDSPCDTCEKKPCLTTCPASAFTLSDGKETAAFDAIACVSHVDSAAGKACQMSGCLARRACPVGKAFAYDREPAAYHMAAVVRTVRKWQAQGESIPPAPSHPDADVPRPVDGAPSASGPDRP